MPRIFKRLDKVARAFFSFGDRAHSLTRPS
jgi:hypothetical protein